MKPGHKEPGFDFVTTPRFLLITSEDANKHFSKVATSKKKSE
jgi:hypothetical protein